jgi:hypothetical protein
MALALADPFQIPTSTAVVTVGGAVGQVPITTAVVPDASSIVPLARMGGEEVLDPDAEGAA